MSDWEQAIEELAAYDWDAYNNCPACGDPIDYCQGHGEIGDPRGYAILTDHDNGNHDRCATDCEGN